MEEYIVDDDGYLQPLARALESPALSVVAVSRFYLLG